MSTEPPVVFTHSGHRFVLGHTAEMYGIWDREAPEAPLERFAHDEHGWAAAWSRFAQLEPQVAAAAVGAATPPATRNWGRTVQPLRPPAIATVALIGVSAVVSVATLVHLFLEIGLVRRIQAGELLTRAEALSFDRRAALLAGLDLAAFIAAGIAWLIWQARAHGNLWAAGVPGLTYTPGWAVGWWFVPLANLVKPYQAVRELHLASDPGASPAGWRASKTSPLLALWWGAWILTVLAGVTLRTSDPELNDVLITDRIRIAGEIDTLVAALLAVLIVRTITRRQVDLLARLGDVPIAPISRDDLASPPASSVTFTHSGVRHILGYDAAGYGIWDRQHPDAPLERFSLDGAGWSSAWARFVALEPQNAPVESPVAWEEKPRSGVAHASRLLGIAALVTGILFLGAFFGPLAIILGSIARGELRRASGPEAERERRVALMGIWMGVAGTMLSAIVIVIANIAD